jgi:hypothetical protein
MRADGRLLLSFFGECSAPDRAPTAPVLDCCDNCALRSAVMTLFSTRFFHFLMIMLSLIAVSLIMFY